jgi:hypothetical protein
MRYRNISFLDILVIINTGKNSIFKLENLMHCSFDRAENTADNDANKEQDLDDRPDIQESKSIPLSIGTVKSIWVQMGLYHAMIIKLAPLHLDLQTQ